MSQASGVTADVITNLSGWAKQPFNSSMGVGGWFLFFGMIMAISVAWAIILKDLKGEL